MRLIVLFLLTTIVVGACCLGQAQAQEPSPPNGTKVASPNGTPAKPPPPAPTDEPQSRAIDTWLPIIGIAVLAGVLIWFGVSFWQSCRNSELEAENNKLRQEAEKIRGQLAEHEKTVRDARAAGARAQQVATRGEALVQTLQKYPQQLDIYRQQLKEQTERDQAGIRGILAMMVQLEECEPILQAWLEVTSVIAQEDRTELTRTLKLLADELRDIRDGGTADLPELRDWLSATTGWLADLSTSWSRSQQSPEQVS